MKKKLIVVILAAILLAALFIPIPTGAYEDGGTKAYTALTYKIVDWNRLTEDGIYQATKLYWFPNNFKSVDDLSANEEVDKWFIAHRTTNKRGFTNTPTTCNNRQS